jgi:PAS domain S-box-containing protein
LQSWFSIVARSKRDIFTGRVNPVVSYSGMSYMKQVSLTKRILVPVTLTFGVLLGAFIYNVYQAQTNDIRVEIERDLLSTEKLYEKQLDAETELLSAIAEILSGDPLLQEAWLAKDRQALLDLSLPILEDLNKQLHITHFYYHDLGRINFLRVYNPGKHGDTISRFTAKEAERTGKTITGVELGKLGTLTLRVVFPWRIDGKVTGYIELGEEIDHIIDKLHEIMDIELYVSIYKDFLNKERWEGGMQLLGRQSSWDLIPDSVIVNHTPQEIPEVFKSFLKKGQHDYMEMAHGIKLSIAGDNFRVGVVPLFDAEGREVGDIVILYNVGTKIASSQRTIILTVILCSLAGLVLFIFYSGLLKKLDTKLSRYQNNLEDMVKERTDELVLSKEQLEQEIAERKLAEADLASEKERLAVTLRSIGDGVITTDTKGNIVLINKIAEDLTGWSHQEALGKQVNDVFRVIDEKTGKQRESPIEKVLATGSIINLSQHTTLLAKDGTVRIIADSGAPIRDEESCIIGVVLVFRDITDQKLMEEELLKVKKLESLGVLAGGIAHDFNNILVSILGNINLATYNLDPDNKIFHLLKKAEKASLRAKDLTMQLLTFSKGGDPVKETASVSETIRDSASFILRGGTVSCNFNIPDDLWFVEVDRGQISQVIQNLIINASDAMPKGGEISISCKNVLSIQDENIPGADTHKNYIKITISDTGVGIPENIIEKIFDPYFSTKEEGSGLGLAIAHSIIIKHDGHITVQSKSDSGTSFNVYLPSSKSRVANKQKKFADTAITGANKILVMDDEPSVRDTLDLMLKELGHRTVLVNNGEEALKQYRKEYESGDPFDLVILDLTIPGGIGGVETAKGILSINPQSRIIVSSGYSNDPIMANCQKHGFVAAIVKPYDILELQNVIGKSISLKNKRGSLCLTANY